MTNERSRSRASCSFSPSPVGAGALAAASPDGVQGPWARARSRWWAVLAAAGLFAAGLSACPAPTPMCQGGRCTFGDGDGDLGDGGSGDPGPDPEPDTPVDYEDPTGEAQLREETVAGGAYRLFVPSGYDGSAMPLVVMLHGCTQTPEAFAAGTKMNELAEAEGFLVAWPEQPVTNHPNRCWRWYEPAQQQRTGSEPSFLAAVVADVQGRFPVDAGRVVVAGLSAGAAMANILAVTHPDVFSGAVVAAGLEYGAVTSEAAAFGAMSAGGPDPAGQGRAAYDVMGSRARPVPILVFHGSLDYVVRPVNGEQVIAQWATTNDLALDGAENGELDDVADEIETGTSPGGRAWRMERHRSSDGQLLMGHLVVDGMGHAWPGGSWEGSYTDPMGPDGSALLWSFFEEVGPRVPAGDGDGDGDGDASVGDGDGDGDTTAGDGDGDGDGDVPAGDGDGDGDGDPVEPGTWSSGTYSGVPYRLYVPQAAGSSPAPLVLALHGCTQSNTAFAQASNLEREADQRGWILVFPEQTNQIQKCWNWYTPGHQARGLGEPAKLAGLVDHVGGQVPIDEDRVYVAGFSAGAAFAVILGATYPDVFRAAAVVAGLEYKAATSDGQIFTAMSNGGPNPQTQAGLAANAMGAQARPVPVIVFHGSTDAVVAPVNGQQVVDQWIQTNDLVDDDVDNDSVDAVPEVEESLVSAGGRSYTVKRYRDTAGRDRVVDVDIQGAGHAWPGGSGTSFADANGPDAARMVCDFFAAAD